MKNKEMPANVEAKINQWLGSYQAKHYWESDGTYFVVALKDGDVYCLRIFPVGDSLELSQDNIIYASNA